ncbi:MAG: hypothetical protein NTY48_04390 [Candidatus Diapherotrites archaeon]|nr:hypothetical protein [Candidatus Diapherotrites archaeon]
MKTPEIILELLSQKWPLKAKPIYYKIIKQKQVSYQSIHKTLQKMVKQKILTKEKQEYSINIKYITLMRKKWETIEQKQNNNQNKPKTL